MREATKVDAGDVFLAAVADWAKVTPEFPEAEALAQTIRRYCEVCRAQGVTPTLEDIRADVLDLEPEIDRQRWVGDPVRFPTTDGGFVRVIDAPPWATVEE